MNGPSRGRSCPISFQYRPEELSGPATLSCSTLYVVGGLYGNAVALHHLLNHIQHDDPAAMVVFNGDFHYLDVAPSVFRDVSETVAAYPAIRGNVEAQLVGGDDLADCGCAYPFYIDDAAVERSNAVVAQLHRTASCCPECLALLEPLPRYLAVDVGGHRVAVVHGDPESLAGWQLALEAIEPGDREVREQVGWIGTPTTESTVLNWFRRAQVRVIASTHTGLPYAQDYLLDGRSHLIVNNGVAGMGNFHGSTYGVVTRLSEHLDRAPGSLYGATLDGLRFDAIPVPFDIQDWSTLFLAQWPPGSPAYDSYYHRITHGTQLRLEQAMRGTLSPGFATSPPPPGGLPA